MNRLLVALLLSIAVLYYVRSSVVLARIVEEPLIVWASWTMLLAVFLGTLVLWATRR